MKIVHISDIHLTENGKSIWGADTMSNFNKVIDFISHITNVDAIVITGDMSDDGTEWTYRYIDNRLSEIGIPTYCCLGNHDSLTTMMQDYKPSFYQVVPKVTIEDWNFLFLNSIMPDSEIPSKNMARGFLNEHAISFVKNELEESKPTCILLHHPPLEPGGWLNRKLLDNRKDFNDVVMNYKNARLVLFGHIHYFSNLQINHIRYSSAPSVGFGFDINLPKYQIAERTEGFSLITINNETINITKICIQDDKT